MDSFNINAAMQSAEKACGQTLSRSFLVLDNLKQRREQIAQQLADHDAAIAALEGNPELTKVLELLAKIGRN